METKQIIEGSDFNPSQGARVARLLESGDVEIQRATGYCGDWTMTLGEILEKNPDGFFLSVEIVPRYGVLSHLGFWECGFRTIPDGLVLWSEAVLYDQLTDKIIDLEEVKKS
jgi:hypothetical protein